MKDNSSKQIFLSVLGVAILIVAVVGVSFAAFTYTGTGEKENTISTGSITMKYTETNNGISITNAMPVDDATGKAITANDAGAAGTTDNAGVFDFTVNAEITGAVTIKYDIMAIKQTDSTLDEQYAKLYLQKDSAATMASATDAKEPTTFDKLAAAATATTESGQGAGSDAKVLYSGDFTTTKTEYFRLRMWVSDSYKVTDDSQTFKVKVNVYGEAAK